MSSFFLYVHDDLSNDPDWKKFGKSMTPYSAVRARQKFCSKVFYLNHIWFGDPQDINFVEDTVKKNLCTLSAKYLKGIGATEVFKIKEKELVKQINQVIDEYGLRVWKQELDEPYSASKSSECPFKIPSEKESYYHLKKMLKNHFPNITKKKKFTAEQKFKELFDLTDEN
jgi:hypothetical protein